jgi:Kef-type K+ transport system membrane component KefB
VRVMFLPAFFALTGLRTEIGLIESASDWAICGVIIAAATAGKFGGTTLAARLAGSDWRNSAALGILMNTRGLVELIVLNIGLDLGVITPRLFTMLVIMALVTTMMTAPILMRLLRRPEQSFVESDGTVRRSRALADRRPGVR